MLPQDPSPPPEAAVGTASAATPERVNGAAPRGTPSPATQIADTVDLVKAYAKQETVDHFKGIGKWVGYGIVGATSLAIGIVLLVVGLLRLLQDVGQHEFYGFWSIVPYLVALLVCALVVALALSRVQATDVHRGGRGR